MTRSQHSVEGSLELLLDTITNTFGSVLFITILVAILLRMSGRSSADREPISQTTRVRTEARVTELSAELVRLKSTLDKLPPADPSFARIEADIVESAQQTARLLADDATVAIETLTDQEFIADIEKRVTHIEMQMEQAKPLAQEQSERRTKAEEYAATLATLAVDLDRPIDPDRIVQTARLPELAATKKEQFGIFMKYGRVYIMHERDKTGERLGPNADHFVILTRSDGTQSARARPDAGHIADGASINQTIRDALRHFPPDNWVVAVIVKEDSFSQFQTIKAALVELGYQYDPIIVRSDRGVWDSGGTSKRGQ